MWDILCAVFAFVAAFALMSRQIMLSPSNEIFPNAPPLVRAAMFLYSMVLLGLHARFFVAIFEPGRLIQSGELEVTILLLGAAAYQAIMTVNLFRQFADPTVWRRVKMASERARTVPPEEPVVIEAFPKRAAT